MSEVLRGIETALDTIGALLRAIDDTLSGESGGEDMYDRDARAAMNGLLANHGGIHGYAPEVLAQKAFAIADAMDAEREKREQGK